MSEPEAHGLRLLVFGAFSDTTAPLLLILNMLRWRRYTLSFTAQDTRRVPLPSGMEAEGHEATTGMRLLRYDRWCRSRWVSVLPYILPYAHHPLPV
jgi:hypothetical protein